MFFEILKSSLKFLSVGFEKKNNIGIIYEEKNTNKKTQEKQQLEKNNEK